VSINVADLNSRLWNAADQLRANSNLRSSEYGPPVLGLIFLRYAEHRFQDAHAELSANAHAAGSRRKIGKADYQARGVLYLPEQARFETLLALPEGTNLGKALNEAMKLVEEANPEIKDVLPKTYLRLENDTLAALLKTFSGIPMDVEGDVFGRIYEYFLGKFAMSEGQRGGEFFTPTSLVRLMVEVVEPFHGRILDPACGSGGMFVQSARFVKNHQKNPQAEISLYGQERVAETVRLCRMNLAVHGLAGEITQANTYYENAHDCVGRFDFVLANPPFNVNGVDKDKIKDDPRYPFGIPRVDNANYLWIQEFYSALNDGGRAGFVMANSAADARGSEMNIRRALVESGAVDIMIAIGSNFFLNVTLPCTLWFLDKKSGTDREDYPTHPSNERAVSEILESGPAWERSGLIVSPARVDSLRFRNDFYTKIAERFLDRRSGMGFGFLAYQLRIADLAPALTRAEARQLFGIAPDDKLLNTRDGTYAPVEVGEDCYYVRVPEVQIISTRSGCEKTNIDPLRDLIRYSLRDGRIHIRSPAGLASGADCKPSYDTKVIVAHALANALVASVIGRCSPGAHFFQQMRSQGMALAHWHGDLTESDLPSEFVRYGMANPGVSCSTPQSALYAVVGKVCSIPHTIEASDTHQGDIHIEPHHGVNVTCSSLLWLANWLSAKPLVYA
jgi:type I restriction enzyme M protein